MPLNLTVVTVSATYLKEDGATPASGTVLFELTSPLLDAAGNLIIAPVRKFAVLDGAGSISVPLVSTLDPDAAPEGVSYKVTEQIDGAAKRVYRTTIPNQANFNLADAVPTESSIHWTKVLNDLDDVDTSGVVTDDVLAYNGSEWVPVPTSAADIATETAARIAADAAEAAARAAAVTAEAVARAAADATEAGTRAADDATEAAARIAGDAAEAAARAADVAAEAGVRSAADAAHEADTTNIHGITDTSALYAAGATDVAVADGGTGASNAAGARTNLDVPQTTRSIGTGTGLSGGGDLSADRTLTIDATVTAKLQETVTAIANAGAAVTIPDVSSATAHRYTLNSATCAFTFPAAGAGKGFTLELRQDGTGGRLATWDALVKWPGGTAPTLTATASKSDIFSFVCLDGVNWYGFTSGLNFA